MENLVSFFEGDGLNIAFCIIVQLPVIHTSHIIVLAEHNAEMRLALSATTSYYKKYKLKSFKVDDYDIFQWEGQEIFDHRRIIT